MTAAAVECPAGTVARDGECAEVQRSSAAIAVDPGTSEPNVRDLRRGRSPRGPRLVATEIQNLRALLEGTRLSDPDRPKLLHRLAEDLSELAASPAAPGREKARQDAIAAYEILARESPGHCNKPPSSGCIDEVIYYIAFEHQEAGDLTKARASYLRLLRDFPQSPFVPYAYFAFGEVFFAESAADPSKTALAEQFYKKITELPDSPIAPHALLRLAELRERAGDQEGAHSKYKKLLAAYPESDAARKVPDWAR